MATINVQVTHEELSKVHPPTSSGCYTVESRTTEDMYEVRKVNGKLTCTCPCGQHGFYNAPNKCWHVRAVIAYVILRQRRMNHIDKLMEMGLTIAEAIQAHDTQMLINGEPATDEELVRVFGRKTRTSASQQRAAQRDRCGNLYSPKFRLLA